MATLRQEKAARLVESGRTMGEVMIEAGYSPNTAKAPTKLTKSKGWNELVDKAISDEEVLRVHKEGLGASKKVFKNNNESGEIELVSEEPDYFARHKYLESAYKIKGKYNDAAININFDNRRIIVTRGESGLVPGADNQVAQTSLEPVGELPVQDSSGREEGA